MLYRTIFLPHSLYCIHASSSLTYISLSFVPQHLNSTTPWRPLFLHEKTPIVALKNNTSQRNVGYSWRTVRTKVKNLSVTTIIRIGQPASGDGQRKLEDSRRQWRLRLNQQPFNVHYCMLLKDSVLLIKI